MSAETYTVGEAARLSVSIVDAGGVADDPATISLEVLRPDGTVLDVPADDLVHPGTGTYRYDHHTDQPGRYVATYRTTLPDTETSIEFDVAPAYPTTVPQTPVYANPADYRQVTGDEPPSDCIRQLANASELIDELLIGAWYDTDADGRASDPAVLAALRRAVCWQVHWEAQTGDPYGLSTVYPSMSIGSVSVSRGPGAAGSGTAWDRAAPRAVSALRTAATADGRALLPRYPTVWG